MYVDTAHTHTDIYTCIEMPVIESVCVYIFGGGGVCIEDLWQLFWMKDINPITLMGKLRAAEVMSLTSYARINGQNVAGR